jgi:hypothetical protein
VETVSSTPLPIGLSGGDSGGPGGEQSTTAGPEGSLNKE